MCPDGDSGLHEHELARRRHHFERLRAWICTNAARVRDRFCGLWSRAHRYVAMLYLTFGTTFNANPTFAAAVRALGSLDANVVVTVGPKGDPDAFGPQSTNVQIERYIPQSLLVVQRCSVHHASSRSHTNSVTRTSPPTDTGGVRSVNRRPTSSTSRTSSVPTQFSTDDTSTW